MNMVFKKIIQYTKKWYNKLVESNDQKYIDTIKEQERLIRQHEILEKEQFDKIKTYELMNKDYSDQIYDLQYTITKQEMQIIDLNNKIAGQAVLKPNIDIDYTKRPYTGYNANIFYNSTTKKLSTNQSLITISKYFRFWNDEFYTGTLNAYARLSKKPKTVKQIIQFAKDVLFNEFGFEYHHDLNHEGVLRENWKTIPQIWADKKIDCEDFTICVVAICNILGVPSDRVFMITGYYDVNGHAYPGFVDEDGLTYILEATSSVAKPIKMKGSKYTSQGQLAGISNWAWAGVPKTAQF